jgi:hypothetical protein
MPTTCGQQTIALYLFQALSEDRTAIKETPSKMPNTAASSLDYKEWIVLDQGELRLETLPGTTSQWIGGCLW